MANSDNDTVKLAAAKEVLAMAGLTKASAIGSDSAAKLKKEREFDALLDY